MTKKTTKKAKKEDLASDIVNPLAGKDFLTIEKQKDGWVVKHLKFTDDDIICETLADQPEIFRSANARFKSFYHWLIKREEAKSENSK